MSQNNNSTTAGTNVTSVASSHHLLLKSNNQSSSIDKTIANLINSNKIKNLGGPFKRLSQMDTVVGGGGGGNSGNRDAMFLGDSENKSLDKKRLKKDKHNIINSNSLLLNNNNNKLLLQQNNKLTNLDNRFKSQINANLLKHNIHPHHHQQQHLISSKNNQKLTVNNLSTFKANESSNRIGAPSQQKSATSSTSLSSRHRLNQLNQQTPHPFNSILSARDDYNEIYDSENNYETTPTVVDSKISNIKKSTENNNNNNNNNSNLTTKAAVTATTTTTTTTTTTPVSSSGGPFDLIELNKRLLTLNNFNIDLNDLNECNTYDAELKLNNVENLEAILSDTKSGLSTSAEKDGYWCFRRKEGCKYLAQNGPIFKHEEKHHVGGEAATFKAVTTTTTTTTTPHKKLANSVTASSNAGNKMRSRLKQLQYYYYGYAITKRGRHLGLVRRRMGRGGRVLMEKFNRNIVDLINATEAAASSSSSSSSANHNDSSQLYSFNYLSKFKTYYPKECFDLSVHADDDNNEDNEGEEENGDSINCLKSLCPPPPPPPPPPHPTQSSSSSSDSIVPAASKNNINVNTNTKLKFKKKFLYNENNDWEQEQRPTYLENESYDDDDDDEEREHKRGSYETEKIDETRPLIFDHNLFSIYQLNQAKHVQQALVGEEEIEIKAATPPCVDSFLNPSVLPGKNSTNKQLTALPITPSTNNQQDEDDSQDFTSIDDYYTQKLFLESDISCEGCESSSSGSNGLAFDENVFESNLIRLNLRPSLALNDEFNSRTNETYLNAASVRLALKNLQSFPVINVKCEKKDEESTLTPPEQPLKAPVEIRLSSPPPTTAPPKIESNSEINLNTKLADIFDHCTSSNIVDLAKQETTQSDSSSGKIR
jgi:hypothetical protein